MAKLEIKEFKTIDEQIAILESRKVNVKDNAFAKKTLENINYYNLTVYRKLLGYDSELDEYKDEVEFEELKNLYELNFELRSFLFKYLLKVETTIKAKISYLHSELYGPLGYKELGNYIYKCRRLNDKGITQFGELHSSFTKELNRSKEEYVVWHVETYKDIPFWVSINLLSFGSLSKLFRILKYAEKRKISKIYNSSPDQLTSWLWQLSIIRNISAHHGVLLCREYKEAPLDDEYLEISEAKSLSSYFCVVFHLLENRDERVTFISELNEIISKNDISDEKLVGFKKDWFEKLEELC